MNAAVQRHRNPDNGTRICTDLRGFSYGVAFGSLMEFQLRRSELGCWKAPVLDFGTDGHGLKSSLSPTTFPPRSRSRAVIGAMHPTHPRWKAWYDCITEAEPDERSRSERHRDPTVATVEDRRRPRRSRALIRVTPCSSVSFSPAMSLCLRVSVVQPALVGLFFVSWSLCCCSDAEMRSFASLAPWR